VKDIAISNCPRESEAWWSDDGAGHITFAFTPVPAADGRNYVKVDLDVRADSKWPAAMEAAKKAGWNFEPVACVRFTNQFLYEVKPTGGAV
jgi:hypothetical protein